MAGPLDDITVLDFSAVISGPMAAQVLADHGASVIKIEWTELLRRIDDLAVALGDISELAGTQDTFGTSVRREGQPMTTWVASYLNNKAATVYGGSNEIQRNLVFRALKSASFDV